MKNILLSTRPKWKDIVGYENEYQINQFGEIRTLKDSPKLKKYDVLKPQISKSNGYVYQMLYKNGKEKLLRVHRLVAEAFIPNPENKPYINHIDGNPHNNNVDNLEWCTPLENVEHASKVLGAMTQYKTANEKRKRAVWQIDYKTGDKIKKFDSIAEASKETGIATSHIVSICRNKFKQCFGYSWCYVESLGE